MARGGRREGFIALVPIPKGMGPSSGAHQVVLRPPLGVGFWIGKPGWLPWTGRERFGADLAVAVGSSGARRSARGLASGVSSPFEGPHAAPLSIPALFFPPPAVGPDQPLRNSSTGQYHPRSRRVR